MAVFCNMIAGIFCLHIGYPAQPQLVAKAWTNGLGGGVEIEGKGWHISLAGTDVVLPFKAEGARHACAGQTCLDFRRACREDTDTGHMHCDYELHLGSSAKFSLDADSKEIQARAVQDIAIYRGADRQSDFPLALLDQAPGP
jgi:hypothetical protein